MDWRNVIPLVTQRELEQFGVERINSYLPLHEAQPRPRGRGCAISAGLRAAYLDPCQLCPSRLALVVCRLFGYPGDVVSI